MEVSFLLGGRAGNRVYACILYFYIRLVGNDEEWNGKYGTQ